MVGMDYWDPWQIEGDLWSKYLADDDTVLFSRSNRSIIEAMNPTKICSQRR